MSSDDLKKMHQVLCINCGNAMYVMATTLAEARLTLYCDACAKLLKLPGTSILEALPPPRAEVPLSENAMDKPRPEPDNVPSVASDSGQPNTRPVTVKHIEVTLDEIKAVILALGSTCIATFEGHTPKIQRAAHEFYDRLLKEVFPCEEDRLIFDLTEMYVDGGKALQGLPLPDEAK